MRWRCRPALAAAAVLLATVLTDVALSGSATGATGSVTRHTFTNAAGSREYDLYAPSRTGSIPLLVYLHGCGAPPMVPGLNQAAERRRFAVAYPIQSTAANAAGCWNWADDAHRHRGSGEPSIIAGITRQVMTHLPIDPAQVFLVGHSAGSGMTANVVAAYPDLYGSAAIIAGCGNLTCLDVTGLSAFREMGPHARAVPAYILWGTADPTNPYWTGRLQLMQWLGMNDFGDDGISNLSVPRLPTTVESYPAAGSVPPYRIEHYVDPRRCAVVDFSSVIGMGHTPDATWQPAFPAIVDFLLAHPMRPDC